MNQGYKCVELKPDEASTLLNHWALTDRGYFIGPFTLVILTKIYNPNLKWVSS